MTLFPIIVNSLRPAATKAAPSIVASLSKTFGTLFKNKGVQAGIGLASIGAAFGFTGNQVKEQVGSELSPFVLIGGIILLLFLVLRGRRR